MNLLVYCAGGFGREIIDVARRVNARDQRWTEISFMDDVRAEKEYYGARVYSFENALQLPFEVVIGSGEPKVRRILREKLAEHDIRLATVIDPSVVVSPTAEIGPGCVVLPNCYISSQTKLSGNISMVAGSEIGHDTTLGLDVVISGHVNIGGVCSIEAEAFLGMGTQVKESTTIGRAAIIGMGSVVYKDIPEGVIAMGNPCRPMQKNVDGYVFHRS